jgi:hypothetical protein
VLLFFGQLVYTANLAWGKLTIIGVCSIAYNLTITHWAAHVSARVTTCSYKLGFTITSNHK